MFKHIGLTINDFSEIKNFYQEIFGKEIVKKISINEQLSQKIFCMQKTDVYLLKKNDLILELFINNHHVKKYDYNHICITVDSRKKIIRKIKMKNYSCISIKRDKYKMEFIEDKSGNIFELKEL